MPTNGKTSRPGINKHSRTTSATKLSAGHSSTRLAQLAGLQFTPAANLSKRKLETNSRAASPFPRPSSRNSAHTAKARDHLQPLHAPSHKAPPSKRKSGRAFTIASSDSEDEDAWTSESASGAVTPNDHVESDPEDDTVVDRMLRGVNDRSDLQRVETARTNGFIVDTTPLLAPKPLPESHSAINLTRPPSLPRIQTVQPTPPPTGYARNQSQTQPSTPNSSRRDNSRRHSHRPPSVHSISSIHQPIRPHPLIRGPSFAGPSRAETTGKPTPTDAAEPIMERSASPTSSLRSLNRYSPGSRRRTSVSSVSTLPLPSPNLASSTLHTTQQRDARERQRTLSTISTSSSHAGISSLFHIPSFSRPPSPPLQSMKSLVGKRTRFPPPPFIHTRDWGADILALPDGTPIHPLLPAPYMQTHFGAMGTRSALRASYDSVSMARAHGRT